MHKILIVDDEQKIRHILQIMLEQHGYRIDQAANGKDALELIQTYHYALVVTDLKMPVMDGMELLHHIKEIDPDYPVIVLTAYGSIESAVAALKQGALDYITKPFEEDNLLVTIRRSIRFSELVAEKRIHREELAETFDFKNIITESQQMLQILKQAAMVSRSPSTTVLLLGESGTGKELLSRAIHFNSNRAAKKFIAINCAAMQPTLIESELFGHEKGSFTGADRQKPGKLELADEGTVFLDEIGDLPLDAQAKLLRFLQEKEFERVGGTVTLKNDVRIIGATNRDLKELVARGQFREDLYYRINVFPLHLPPLRERRRDIVPLTQHFLQRCGQSMGRQNLTMTQEARNMLSGHSWPGNIRELQNAIERAVILSDGGVITPVQLGFLTVGPRGPQPEQNPDGIFTLPRSGVDMEGLERELVRQALEAADNNQMEAARLLGLSRGKFRVLLKRLKEQDEND